MSVSQSGYPDIASYSDPRVLSNPTVPGTDVKILGGVLKGDVGTIILYVAARYDKEVEPLVQSHGCWGGQPQHNDYVSNSNHESWTAVDLNATEHPIGTDPASNFTAGQIAAGHRILNDCITDGVRVVRWGADYNGRKDGMHWEINDNLYGNPVVARLAARIRAGQVPNVPAELRTPPTSHGGQGVPVPSKPPAPTPTPPAPAPTYTVTAPGVGVKQVQTALNKRGTGLAVDGIYGAKTRAAVESFQRSHGLTVDGITGPKTWAALNAPAAPPYPLPAGYYYGPLSGPKECISGAYKTDKPEWRAGLKRWQQRMKDRGWTITPDGIYGPQTGSVALAFKKEKHVGKLDRNIGRAVWNAAWEEPVT